MEEPIRLWTFQTPLAWSLLQQNRTLSGDGRRADPFFRPAYRWLMEQMAVRTEGYTGRFPIWFWDKKPDFRQYRFRNYTKPGESVILLECLIPRNRVLLSDYETWHSVLNKSHISLSEAEFDAWYERLDSGTYSSAQMDAEIRESWQRVFDFEALSANPEWAGPPTVQATVETLRLEEVVRARVFTSRRARQ